MIFIGHVQLVALQQTNELVFRELKELFCVGDQEEVLKDELASCGLKFGAGVHVCKPVNSWREEKNEGHIHM